MIPLRRSMYVYRYELNLDIYIDDGNLKGGWL